MYTNEYNWVWSNANAIMRRPGRASRARRSSRRESNDGLCRHRHAIARPLSRSARLARQGAGHGRAALRERRRLERRDGQHHADADREIERHGAGDPVRRNPGIRQGLSHPLRPFLVAQAPRAHARAAAPARPQGRYRAALPPPHAEPEDASAALREGRAGAAERARRRRDRRAEVSGAAAPREGHGPLHRHRLLRHDPGSRLRLVQPRRLSLAGL